MASSGAEPAASAFIPPLSEAQGFPEKDVHEHRILLWHDKISIAPGYTIPEGPGEEEVARRQAIREYLHTILAQLDEADSVAKVQP